MHEELILKGAAHTIDVAEVVDRGAARVDARLQRVDHRPAQAPALRSGQASRGAQRMDTRPVQGLVGVDVAHPGDPALVEQQRLDRCRAPLHEGVQVGGGEALVQRLEPQAQRKELLERLCTEQQLSGAKAPWVYDHEPALGAQLHVNPHVCGFGLGLAEHGAGHPQVLREVHISLEAPHEVLSTTPQRLDAPSDERIGQFIGRQRSRPARVEDLHCMQHVPLHQRGELASDRLHLG